MTKVAIATGRRNTALNPSNLSYAKALGAAGAEVLTLRWNADPRSSFQAADAVVLRQTWDYQYDPSGFAAWAIGLEAQGTPLMNPAASAIWNNDKRTLLDLADEEVAVPATADLTELGPEAAMEAVGGDAFVIKPAVGGSGQGVVRSDRAGLTAAIEASGREAPGRPLMLQAFLPEIRDGEWSLCWIDGAFSHAVRLVPVEGEFRVNSRFGASREALDPPEAARRSAEALLRRVPWRWLYARVDGVMRDGAFVVTELELTDPELYLALVPGSAERLAAATVARIEAAEAT
ncbi:MAG: hypothetical protein AAGI51_14770 [Pseudomonadota bacterium]